MRIIDEILVALIAVALLFVLLPTSSHAAPRTVKTCVVAVTGVSAKDVETPSLLGRTATLTTAKCEVLPILIHVAAASLDRPVAGQAAINSWPGFLWTAGSLTVGGHSWAFSWR